MNVFKNKNLIIVRINDDFYSVVNPCIKDGLRVINSDQYDVLSLIEDNISIEKLSQKTGIDEYDLTTFFNMLEKQDIVNYNGNFLSVENMERKLSSFTLWVHTTNNCCLRCSYCNIHTLGEHSFMDEATINQLSIKIVEVVEKYQLKNVTLRLAGGEPLLQWKLWKSSMNDLKKKLNLLGCSLRIVLLTNLVLLSDEIIQWIVEDNIGVSVSFDGIGKYQDMSRHFKNGEGSFNIVVRNIEKLLSHGIHPMIMTVVSNNNVEGLPELTKFLISHNLVFRYSFVQFEPLDIKKVVIQMKKCFNILSEAIDHGYQFSKMFNLCDLKFLYPTVQTCSNGFSGAAAYVDGDIYFCHTHFGYKPKIGSVFENDDLIHMLQEGSYYGEDVSNDCINCKLKYVCTSGCPLERECGKDPHCTAYKELVPIVYKLMGKERLYRIFTNN